MFTLHCDCKNNFLSARIAQLKLIVCVRYPIAWYIRGILKLRLDELKSYLNN